MSVENIVNSQEAKERLNEVRNTAHFYLGHTQAIPANECKHSACADIGEVIHWIAEEEDRTFAEMRRRNGIG